MGLGHLALCRPPRAPKPAAVDRDLGRSLPEASLLPGGDLPRPPLSRIGVILQTGPPQWVSYLRTALRTRAGQRVRGLPQLSHRADLYSAIFLADGGNEQAKSLCFASLVSYSSHRSNLSTGWLPYRPSSVTASRRGQDRTGPHAKHRSPSRRLLASLLRTPGRYNNMVPSDLLEGTGTICM